MPSRAHARRALTESEHLHDWFPAHVVGERAKGARVTLTSWPEADQQPQDTPTLQGEILEWDPPHTFAFMWDSERG